MTVEEPKKSGNFVNKGTKYEKPVEAENFACTVHYHHPRRITKKDESSEKPAEKKSETPEEKSKTPEEKAGRRLGPKSSMPKMDMCKEADKMHCTLKEGQKAEDDKVVVTMNNWCSKGKDNGEARHDWTKKLEAGADAKYLYEVTEGPALPAYDSWKPDMSKVSTSADECTSSPDWELSYENHGAHMHYLTK